MPLPIFPSTATYRKYIVFIREYEMLLAENLIRLTIVDLTLMLGQKDKKHIKAH